MAGEDEREGGALMNFGRRRPLAIGGSSREYPSPMRFVEQARREGPFSKNSVWIDVEKPFWWDVPIWLASEQINSIGLANNHMCRSGVYASEAWGRPRDAKRLPPPLGNGYWTQEIYYHLLSVDVRPTGRPAGPHGHKRPLRHGAVSRFPVANVVHADHVVRVLRRLLVHVDHHQLQDHFLDVDLINGPQPADEWAGGSTWVPHWPTSENLCA